MAALNRPTQATYELHESVRVDTLDNEDHTFCGIMFPIKAKALPIERLFIHSVAVRGQLGPMTVWVSNNHYQEEDINNMADEGCDDETTTASATTGSAPQPQNQQIRTRSQTLQRQNQQTTNRHHQQQQRGGGGGGGGTRHQFQLTPRHWTKIYSKTHEPSFHQYVALELDTPIELRPGQVRAIYIHSTLSGDEAIVYDNSRLTPAGTLPWNARNNNNRRIQANGAAANNNNLLIPRYEDANIKICSGKAHLSAQPFGQVPIWGWGNAWRDRREFVGQIQYGLVYKLWNPVVASQFGSAFSKAALSLASCRRYPNSALASLPDECIFYILNMCRWDWFDDTLTTLKLKRKLQRQQAAKKRRQRRKEQQHAVEQAAATPSANSCALDSQQQHMDEDSKSAHPKSADNDDDDDEDDQKKPAACTLRHRGAATGACSAPPVNAIDYPPPRVPCVQASASATAATVSPQADLPASGNMPVIDQQLLAALAVAAGGGVSDLAQLIAAERAFLDHQQQSMQPQQHLPATQGQQPQQPDEDGNSIADENDDRNSTGNNGNEVANDGNESDWERENGYHADGNILSYTDDSSSDDDEEDDDGLAAGGRSNNQQQPRAAGGPGVVPQHQQLGWFQRNLARLNVVRALAHADRDDVVEINY